jgi:DNA-binding NtrC family response regulator
MATQIFAPRSDSEDVDEMDALRSQIRSLLHEASLRTMPVNIDSEKGIDFYENVALFEIHLIESALEMSGGRQNYAAKLLNMKASTLCTKIKQLKIRRARKTAKRKGY